MELHFIKVSLVELDVCLAHVQLLPASTQHLLSSYLCVCCTYSEARLLESERRAMQGRVVEQIESERRAALAAGRRRIEREVAQQLAGEQGTMLAQRQVSMCCGTGCRLGCGTGSGCGAGQRWLCAMHVCRARYKSAGTSAPRPCSLCVAQLTKVQTRHR